MLVFAPSFIATFCRALSALAIFGLLLSPLGGNAMAMSAQPQSAMAADHDMAAMADHDMSAMSADAMMSEMPCCPADDHKGDCGKDCPLMAACMAQTLANMPAAYAPVIVYRLLAVMLPADERRLGSLSSGPPPRPPKA